MARYNFYLCVKCDRPYFGGLRPSPTPLFPPPRFPPSLARGRSLFPSLAHSLSLPMFPVTIPSIFGRVRISARSRNVVLSGVAACGAVEDAGVGNAQAGGENGRKEQRVVSNRKDWG